MIVCFDDCNRVMEKKLKKDVKVANDFDWFKNGKTMKKDNHALEM